MATRFATFAEFYPFYLSEHRNRTCRRLHFAGTSLYSFIGDWAMFRDILLGRIPL